MPTRKIFTPTHPEVKLAKALYAEIGSKTGVALKMGISQSKCNRLFAASKEEEKSESKNIIFPSFPNEELSAEETLNYMERSFEKKKAHQEAQSWFEIKMPTDDVIGLAAVGDPHIGSNQCNVSRLRTDIDTMKEYAVDSNGKPMLVALNCGDTVDNWAGYSRLMSLYSENDVSRQTERRLARWFLKDSGIRWLVWLFGNHDLMDREFSTYLKTINGSSLPMVDWEARFQLVFPNKERVRVDLSHSHKGSSIYNRLHGSMRRALWHENADIYITGHLHNWAIQHQEMDDGRVITMARARGYKWQGEYEIVHGFHNDQFGATILFVIDPRSPTPVGRVQTFADLQTGAEYLKWLREKRNKEK